MNSNAKKYQKFVYFTKDARINHMINTAVEAKKPMPGVSEDKFYPYNCVSKYYPIANMSNKYSCEFVLPCGFKLGQSWRALIKCWKMYKYHKRIGDENGMREYATRIQKLETEIGVPTASFPNLGMIGDIFFLYDKDKEKELRQKYLEEKIVCDRFGAQSIDEMVEKGEAIICHSRMEVERLKDKERYKALSDLLSEWAMSDETQKAVKVMKRKWLHREKLRKDIERIKKKLKSIKGHGKKHLKERLKQQIILKESELESVKAVSIVRTDQGYKYCKEILEDWKRKDILYDYTPRYYLTDVKGHRLGNYWEEQKMGYVNDPYFYKLYLEDKEWEKIYSKELD